MRIPNVAHTKAGVAELADARDSNSRVLTDLWVRFPPPAQLTQGRSPMDVERFLTPVSFDSRAKIEELGFEIDTKSDKL